jgi:hypothetical protein
MSLNWADVVITMPLWNRDGILTARWRLTTVANGFRVVATHKNSVDSMAIHIDNLEPEAAALKDVSCSRNTSRREHDQAAERVIVLSDIVGQERVCANRPRDRFEIEGAIQKPAAVLTPDNRRFLVWFGRQIADDLRDHIPQTDQSLDAAEFIDDEGNREVRTLEVFEESHQRHAFRDEQHCLRQLWQVQDGTVQHLIENAR